MSEFANQPFEQPQNPLQRLISRDQATEQVIGGSYLCAISRDALFRLLRRLHCEHIGITQLKPKTMPLGTAQGILALADFFDNIELGLCGHVRSERLSVVEARALISGHVENQQALAAVAELLGIDLEPNGDVAPPTTSEGEYYLLLYAHAERVLAHLARQKSLSMQDLVPALELQKDEWWTFPVRWEQFLSPAVMHDSIARLKENTFTVIDNPYPLKKKQQLLQPLQFFTMSWLYAVELRTILRNLPSAPYLV